VAPLLDRLPDGGVINDRQKLGQVVREQPEVQRLVAVVEKVEVNVLREVVPFAAQLLVCPRRLVVERLHRGREPTDQSQPATLVLGKRRAAIGVRVP
jgi:hypothetical protein